MDRNMEGKVSGKRETMDRTHYSYALCILLLYILSRRYMNYAVINPLCIYRFVDYGIAKEYLSSLYHKTMSLLYVVPVSGHQWSTAGAVAASRGGQAEYSRIHSTGYSPHRSPGKIAYYILLEDVILRCTYIAWTILNWWFNEGGPHIRVGGGALRHHEWTPGHHLVSMLI